MVRLQVLYRRSGFPNAEIDTTLRRTPRDVYITFRIQEGEPITVTPLEMLGVDSLPDWLQRVVKRGPPPAGGGPVQSLPDAGLGATRSPDGSRTGDTPMPRVFTAFEADRQALIAKVDLEALPGKRAVIGDVRVVGIEPGGALGGAQPPDLTAGPALFGGGAVPESAEPVRLGSLPVRHGEHRLGRVPAGQAIRSLSWSR